MPSLASCYFCGEAVGASLEEYDLLDGVPDDEQVSVTLCAGCRGKLSALLEEISTASGSPESAATTNAAESTEPGTTDADGPSDLDPVAGDREPIFEEDEDALLDDDRPDAPGDDGQFATESDSGADDPTTDDSSSDGLDPDDSPPDGSPAEESPGDDSGADEASVDGTARGNDGASERERAEPEAVEDPAPSAKPSPQEPPRESSPQESSPSESSPQQAEAGSREDDRGAQPVEVGAGGSEQSARSATSESGGSATSQRSSDGPLADVSPRTYNRVVRLLQNREFPVDRADFEALATSAYELDHGECSAALDAAIDRGLLDERDGSLHRPA